MKCISNILEETQSTSAPEIDIQKDEIGSLGSDELKKTLLSVSGDDIIAFFEEFFLVEQLNRWIVVDDKNSFHVSRLVVIEEDSERACFWT